MTKDKKSGGTKGKKKHVHRYDRCEFCLNNSLHLIIDCIKDTCKCGKVRHEKNS